MAETRGFGGVDISDQIERKDRSTFETLLLDQLWGIKMALLLLATEIAGIGLWWFFLRR